MGRRISTIFNKRFKDQIRIVYAQKSSASEKQFLNGELCKAIIKVLTGILGRAPTQRELLGIDDISKHIKKPE
jgi:hypothetical protein